MTTSWTVPSCGDSAAGTGWAAGAGPPRMLRAWMGCDMGDVLPWSGWAVGGRTAVKYGPGRGWRPKGSSRSQGADHHVTGPEPVLGGREVVVLGAAGGPHHGGRDDAAVGPQRLAVHRTVHEQPARGLLAAPCDLLHDQDRLRDPLLPQALRRVETGHRLDGAGVDEALHLGAEAHLRDNGNARGILPGTAEGVGGGGRRAGTARGGLLERPGELEAQLGCGDERDQHERHRDAEHGAEA